MYKIILLRVNKDVFYKTLFHVPLFVELQPGGQKVFTVLSLHISNIYAKKKGIAKKIIQTSCNYDFSRH